MDDNKKKKSKILFQTLDIMLQVILARPLTS